MILKKYQGTNVGIDNRTWYGGIYSMDLDFSGVIDAADITAWKQFYSMTLPAPGAGGATAPEPSAALLAILAAIAATLSSRHRR